MALKHSINIFLSRFNLVYKMVVYFFVIVLVLSALNVSIVAPSVSAVIADIKSTGVLHYLKEGCMQFIRGEGEFSDSFNAMYNSFGEVQNILSGSGSTVVLLITVTLCTILVGAFLLSLSFLPFSDIINHFMNSKSNFDFLSNMVANVKKAAQYALAYTFIGFTLSALILYGSMLLFAALFKTIGLFSLPVVYAAALIAFSLKSVIFSGWLPAIVCDGKGIFRGFAHGLRQIAPHFTGVFWNFMFAHILGVSFVAIFGIVTFGVGFFVAVPSVFMVYRTLELVLYYNAKGYKYYVDKERVVRTSVFTERV